MKNKKEEQGLKKMVKTQKIFGIILFAFILIIIWMNFVSADTLYWVGVNNGNWSDSSNWASTSGGAGGAGIPNATNGVVFDFNNTNNSIINDSIAVYSINVSIGYNGTITQKMNWNSSLKVSEKRFLNILILWLIVINLNVNNKHGNQKII